MQLRNFKKIVIKLGSSTVVDKKGLFKKHWVKGLINDIIKFKKRSDIVIVSSGNCPWPKLFKTKKEKNKN